MGLGLGAVVLYAVGRSRGQPPPPPPPGAGWVVGIGDTTAPHSNQSNTIWLWPERAHDGDDTTVARLGDATNGWWVYNSWTPYLIIQFPPTMASGVRFNGIECVDAGALAVHPARITVEVSPDGVNWTLVYDGSPTPNVFIEPSFSEQEVQYARYAAYCTGTYAANLAYLNELQIYGSLL